MASRHIVQLCDQNHTQAKSIAGTTLAVMSRIEQTHSGSSSLELKLVLVFR